jgi:hypothetical protein
MQTGGGLVTPFPYVSGFYKDVDDRFSALLQFQWRFSDRHMVATPEEVDVAMSLILSSNLISRQTPVQLLQSESDLCNIRDNEILY